jgi:hypothetical protein
MLNMEFESAGAVMAFLRRSGLAAWDGRTAAVSMVKGLPYEDARRFQDAWNSSQDDRQVILPDGMTITPLENGPAGPEDDRFEWINIATVSDAGPVWTKGACRHRHPEPVDTYPTGELVRWLCVDCGEEFEPDRWPLPEGMWRRIPERVLNSPMTMAKENGQLRFEVHHVRGPFEAMWDGFVAVWERLRTAAELAFICWPIWVWVIWVGGSWLGWWDA